MCVVCECSVPRVAACLVVETKRPQCNRCATIYTPWDNYMTLRAELDGKAVNQIGLSTFDALFCSFSHERLSLLPTYHNNYLLSYSAPYSLDVLFRLLVHEHIS